MTPTPPEHQTTAVSAFDLPAHLAAKADPVLIADDERHFAAIAGSLERTVADLTGRLDAARRVPAGAGQAALDRDLEVHRLTARLRTLLRYGLDLCLGHVVPADGSEPVYVGRLGLTDTDGTRLLVDWRSPVAEPFFGATHADPMGLASRRRYRWARGRVSDYWDEVFTTDGLVEHAAALDDQSAFIAGLGATRSPRMRDVLGTIAADQDAVVRAGSKGALVVDGGPGTGKTVVALHRTAYLLYSDPRLGHRMGGVLFVGPHQRYLAYVADVLPSLGEEGVQTCTLRDLVPEGAAAVEEADPRVARLKADARLVSAIEPAVRLYEEPPTEGLAVATPWGDVWVGTDDWADAFDAPPPGAAHNESRDVVWEALLGILVDTLRDEFAVGAGDDPDAGWGDDDTGPGDDFDAYGLTPQDPLEELRRALAANRELVEAFGRAWPLIEPTDLVGDLWSVPAYLRRCAPWLERDDVFALQRDDPAAWTASDLPLLDAARRRLGDPEAPRRRARRAAADAAERERMADVVADLIASDDSEMHVMSMLRGQDLRTALVDEDAVPGADADLLAGPFAHVVVDEAQELTDAEWQMVLGRCPSRSLTIVGDRAQARHGFTESWQERLARVGLHRVDVASLNINYRTPQEVMAQAEPVIRAAIPDANVPTSIRRTDVPVVHAATSGLSAVLDGWLAANAEGVACVIGDPAFAATARVQLADPPARQGARVRPRRARRPAALRRGHRGGGRPLRGDDPRDPAARHPHEWLTGSADEAEQAVLEHTGEVALLEGVPADHRVGPHRAAAPEAEQRLGGVDDPVAGAAQPLQGRQVEGADQLEADVGGEPGGLLDRDDGRRVPAGAEVGEPRVGRVTGAHVVDDDQRAARAQHARGLAEERRGGVGVHERLDREGQVELGEVVRKSGVVGHLEPHAPQPRPTLLGVPLREPDLGRADRDAHHLDRQPVGEVERGRADPAAQVEHPPVVRAELIEHQRVGVVHGLTAGGHAGPPQLAVDRPLAAGEQELPGVRVVVPAHGGTATVPRHPVHDRQCANDRGRRQACSRR